MGLYGEIIGGFIPPDCLVPISSSHLLLSIFLIIGIVVSYLPQQLKIIWTKSSDGLSPWYLLLGAVSSISNLFNIIVLQIPILRCCGFVSWGQCLYNSLGLFQMISQIAMFLSMYSPNLQHQCLQDRFALFYMYYPDEKRYLRRDQEDEEMVRPTQDWRDSLRIMKIVIIYSTFITFVSILISTAFGVPSGWATIWTALLAVIALVSSLIQFLPQILRTWKLKVVGALSIPAMMMQTPGSFLFCYTLAISPGTNFTSWMTYFVGGCLQGILLILCLYYQETMPTEFIHIREDDTDRSSIVLSPAAQLLDDLDADFDTANGQL